MSDPPTGGPEPFPTNTQETIASISGEELQATTAADSSSLLSENRKRTRNGDVFAPADPAARITTKEVWKPVRFAPVAFYPCKLPTSGYHILMKQRSNRRTAQTSVRRDTDPGPITISGTSWFEQGLAQPLYSSGSIIGPDFADLVSQFPGVDETGAVTGFNGWETFSSTPLNPLVVPSGQNEALLSTATPITDDDHDRKYLDDEDPPDALSSQLTSLSQRARQAMRRLVRPGRMPLTVSSPEVKEALEDTNTLIRIMKYITTPDRDEKMLDPTITDCGLAFSALACHQHLVALFRAICDAIHRCLQSKDENQLKQDHLNRQQGDVGPFSVAQFVMVLQLLMHLINRMDRSLSQNNPSICQGAPLFASGYITPVTPNGPNRNSIDVLQPEAAVGGSSPGGLLVLVRDIVGTIPNEHEKLRQVIQTLQTEMEHSELH